MVYKINEILILIYSQFKIKKILSPKIKPFGVLKKLIIERVNVFFPTATTTSSTRSVYLFDMSLHGRTSGLYFFSCYQIEF